MTVVRPNSISGINSITVATGEALSIHGADGALVSTLTNTSGIATYKGIHVGSGTTTANQGVIVGTGASIVSDAVNELSIYTNNTERLRILSNGRIGIGTDDPGGQKLELYNPTSAFNILSIRTGAGAYGQAGIAFGSNQTKDRQKATIFFQERTGSAHHAGDLCFSVDNAGGDAGTADLTTERLRIQGAGHVGIGTSMPTDRVASSNSRILNVGIVTANTVYAAGFIPSNGQLSHRNLIINGAMQVAQRGTSAAATINYATVDRFSIVQSGGQNSPDQAQSALSSSDSGPWADGLRYSYKMTNGAQSSADANDYSLIVYKVESQDMAQSGWDYGNTSSDITLSFWVRASVGQTYYFDLVSQDTTSQGYCMSAALSANTWTKIERTIPGASGIVFNSDNGSGLEINWNLYYGSDYTDAGRALNTWAAWASGTRTPVNDSSWWLNDNATFEITGVQFEVGSVATPFEHRSFGDELRRCQRYYYKITGSSDQISFGYGRTNGTTSVEANIPLPVPLRASPSLTCAGNTAWSTDNSSSTTAPTVRLWNGNRSDISLVFTGHSGLTNAKGANIFCSSGSNLELDSEL